MSTLQADIYHLFGSLFRFHAHSPDTGGAYCLIETLTAPGAGSPPNRHPDDDEAFYILEGLFEFMVDGETVQARTGSFVKIPTGAIHAFRNIGPAPGRLLIINSPGRVHDGFFTEAGAAMPLGTCDLPPPGGKLPDIARVVEIGRRNGLELLMPDGELH